jgi:hypothetical protein
MTLNHAARHGIETKNTARRSALQARSVRPPTRREQRISRLSYARHRLEANGAQ